MDINQLKLELDAVKAAWEATDCHDEATDLEEQMYDLQEQIDAAENDEKFIASRFRWNGLYLKYERLTGEEVFIARFKYAAQKKRQPAFRRALIGKNVDLYLKLADMTTPAEAVSRMTATA